MVPKALLMTEVIKNKPADSVRINDDDGINKHSESSRDQCINENISAATDDSDLSEKSAEVSMSKELSLIHI